MIISERNVQSRYRDISHGRTNAHASTLPSETVLLLAKSLHAFAKVTDSVAKVFLQNFWVQMHNEDDTRWEKLYFSAFASELKDSQEFNYFSTMMQTFCK